MRTILLIGISLFFGTQIARGGETEVIGDIYSGTNIGNIKIGAKSVIASKGTINATGTEYKISNYKMDSVLQWTTIQAKMNKNKTRLISERKKDLNKSTIWGTFNLNPDNIPEGQVWYRNGDLTIEQTTFSGKGTIIVVEGNVTIRGNLSYSNSFDPSNSLGIIADNISITSNVEKIVGIFYASREIKIE